jgi:hypothetical protein
MCIPIWYVPVGLILLFVGACGAGELDEAAENKKNGKPWVKKFLVGTILQTVSVVTIGLPILTRVLSLV